VLILYKPFRFSDVEFETSGRVVGYYNKNPFDITVNRVSTSPDLYDVLLYDFDLYYMRRDIFQKIMFRKTEAEIEAYINTRIFEFRHANLI